MHSSVYTHAKFNFQFIFTYRIQLSFDLSAKFNSQFILLMTVSILSSHRVEAVGQVLSLDVRIGGGGASEVGSQVSASMSVIISRQVPCLTWERLGEPD